jgi:hypothetical protein
MKTSKQWWESVKNNQSLLNQWLMNQYHGEVKAAQKIEELILSKEAPSNQKRIVKIIVEQEKNHAVWIGQLLTARGITPKVLQKKERYWDKTLSQIVDWDTGCAVAAHAERMRLERIRVICEDKDTPEDIRLVFEKILVEEEFHAATFDRFTTGDAILATWDGHAQGMEELGLEI